MPRAKRAARHGAAGQISMIIEWAATPGNASPVNANRLAMCVSTWLGETERLKAGQATSGMIYMKRFPLTGDARPRFSMLDELNYSTLEDQRGLRARSDDCTPRAPSHDFKSANEGLTSSDKFASNDQGLTTSCQASKTAFRSHCARPYGTLRVSEAT